MLTREEQVAAYELVKFICKGTKFEGKEYLCVKYKQPGFDTEYQQYTDDGIDFSVPWGRIFAVAIVDDTPIWLEEPFTLYQASNDLEFTYRTADKRLIGTRYGNKHINALKVSIPIENVVWKSFTLTKPTITTKGPDTKQVGGTHYKSKAIQPWAYMKANYTKEEFVGFLRGNAHKYLDRYKCKNGIEDLEKAIHYIEKLIEVEGK